MSNTLGAAVVSIAFVLIFSLGLGSLFTAHRTFSDATRVVRQQTEERIRSDLRVAAATQTAAATVEIRLTNQGQTPLWDLAHTDVFVQVANPPQTVWLRYSAGALEPGSWVRSAVEPDLLQPGILNPGETMLIQAQLPQTAAAQLVKVATPAGIVASAYVGTP